MLSDNKAKDLLGVLKADGMISNDIVSRFSSYTCASRLYNKLMVCGFISKTSISRAQKILNASPYSIHNLLDVMKYSYDNGVKCYGIYATRYDLVGMRHKRNEIKIAYLYNNKVYSVSLSEYIRMVYGNELQLELF